MDTKSIFKKFFLFCFSFLVLFFLLYQLQWIGYPKLEAPFLQTPDYCISYLKEGTLYRGQPYCFQGPVTYITAALLESLFSDLKTGLLFAYIPILFVIALLTFLIISHETGKDHFFLVPLFILFVFGNITVMDFTTFLLIPSLLLGFYILNYTQFQGKYFCAGLFFAFSIFSKPHNPPFAIAPILVFWFFREFNKYRAANTQLPPLSTRTALYSFLRESRKTFLCLALPGILLFIIFLILFPGFITYNYVIHTYNDSVQSLSSIFIELVTFTYWYNGLFLLLYIGIFIAFVRLFFYKKCDVFSFISSISFLALVFLVGNKFSLYQLIDQYRYFTIFIPFFLTMIFLFVKEFQEHLTKECISLFSIFLFCLGIALWLPLSGLTLHDFIANKGINDQKIVDRIKLDLEMPLLDLPKPEGKIFVSSSYFHRYDLLFDDLYENPLDEDPFHFLEKDDFINYYNASYDTSHDPDMAVAQNFVEIGILQDIAPYFSTFSVDYTTHLLALQNGTYSIIITTPYTGDKIYVFFQTAKEFGLPKYCRFEHPFYTEGNNNTNDYFINFLFLDKTTCKSFYTTATTYFSSSFDRICHRGKPFVEIVYDALSEKGFSFGKECNSMSALFLLNNAIKFKVIFFVLLLWLYLVGIYLKVTLQLFCLYVLPNFPKKSK